MKSKKAKFVTVLLMLISFTLILTSTFTTQVRGNEDDLEDELKQLEEELKAIEREKEEIWRLINSKEVELEGHNQVAQRLYGEVMLYQKDIDELNLQIKELELSIEKINQDIVEIKEDIVVKEKTIAILEEESKLRIQNAYINFRTSGVGEISGKSVFSTDDINSVFKDTAYKEIIQADTNDMLRLLAQLKEELNQQQVELAEKLKTIENEKNVIAVKKADLDKRQSEVQAKYNAYYAEMASIQRELNSNRQTLAVFSEEEAKKRAEAERIRNEIFNSWNPTIQGEFVKAGRIIGTQGCTGLCTGDHLHFIVWDNGSYKNPCAYLPGGAMGCGYGTRLTDPFKGAGVIFTSGYGERCFWWGKTYYCDFHNGVDAAGSKNAVIYATHDGYAFKGVDPYGAKYVIICESSNCKTGIKTGYWHLNSF